VRVKAGRRATPLRIREVRDPNDKALAGAYRLLQRAFTAGELVPRRDLREAMMERNRGILGEFNWHMFVAERGKVVVGVATISYVGELNIGMIGYLAVRPIERSTGLGLRLRAKLLQAVRRDALRIRHRPLEALVGEVRAGNPWLRHLVSVHQALALDFPYWQPSIDGTASPVRLVLYYQPTARERQSLGVSEVRRLLYVIWRRVYRVPRPMKNPTFRKMLKALHGRRLLGSQTMPGTGPVPRKVPPRRSPRPKARAARA
jgi:GNAT superfamily N-acetyltransferase